LSAEDPIVEEVKEEKKQDEETKSEPLPRVSTEEEKL